MTRRVFVTYGVLQPGRVVTLTPDEAHYLLRVRRAAAGDDVEVLDGHGGHVQGRIVTATGSRCEVELGAPIASPLPMPLTLWLGMPDPRATLDAITNAGELGATTIVLVRCERSQGNAPSSERIARCLRAMSRQCGRPLPPPIVGPIALAEALARNDPHPRFVAHRGPDDRAAMPRIDPAIGATVLVGPEGGLTDAEIAAVRTAGLRPISLGPWILRTETAVTAALARLLARA